MADATGYSKREVSRAGSHLAERLHAVRRGERTSTVDEGDPDDLRTQAKRFDTMIEKLTCEPGKLAAAHRGSASDVRPRCMGEHGRAGEPAERRNYKAGQGDEAVLRFFGSLADMLATVELGEQHPDLAPRLYEDFESAPPMLRMPMLRDLGP